MGDRPFEQPIVAITESVEASLESLQKTDEETTGCI
jgi:hypothetical protein